MLNKIVNAGVYIISNVPLSFGKRFPKWRMRAIDRFLYTTHKWKYILSNNKISRNGSSSFSHLSLPLNAALPELLHENVHRIAQEDGAEMWVVKKGYNRSYSVRRSYSSKPRSMHLHPFQSFKPTTTRPITTCKPSLVCCLRLTLHETNKGSRRVDKIIPVPGTQG